MGNRNYSSKVTEKTLDASLSAVAAGTTGTMQLAPDLTSLPSYPFTMVIEPDTANEEIVTVTGLAAGSNTVNITRGQESSATTPTHASGTSIKVRHMVTARDIQEVQDHAFTSAGNPKTSGIHGVTGNVVGTTDTQTLTNKSLTAPTLTGTTTNTGTISGGTISSATLSGTITNSGTISGGTISATSVPASGITGSWTSWTPSTSWTINTSTNSSKYIQIGKTVYFNLYISATGTISTTGTLTFSLPVAPVQSTVSHGWFNLPTYGDYELVATITSGSSNATVKVPTTTALNTGSVFYGQVLKNLTSSVDTLGTITSATTRVINIAGFYEVA